MGAAELVVGLVLLVLGVLLGPTITDGKNVRGIVAVVLLLLGLVLTVLGALSFVGS
jgi:hypothetical protein